MSVNVLAKFYFILFSVLQTAIASRDIQKLKTALTQVEKLALKTRLSNEVITARYLLESLARVAKIKQHMLAMDNKPINELRSYNSPPSMVLPIVQAMLLVLGSPESATKVSKMNKCRFKRLY